MSQLNPVQSIDVARAWVARARDRRLLVTNFFLDEEKVADWIRQGCLYESPDVEDCMMLVVRQAGFDLCLIAAADYQAAAEAVSAYAGADQTCVVDIVGREPQQVAARAAFEGQGFSVLKSLTRLSRRSVVERSERLTPPGYRPLNARDAELVYQALQTHFDPRAEQLPSIPLVARLCETGCSYGIFENGVVAAFILGEITGKKGVVRYWFTDPSTRGKGYGGLVIRSFFDKCLEVGSSFQELWVLDDNENAIKRYAHYGFSETPMKDTVFIKNAGDAQ